MVGRRPFLSTCFEELFTFQPLLLQRLEIRTIGCEVGVNQSVRVGLVVEYNIQGDQKVCLSGAGQPEHYEGWIRRPAHTRPKAQKSRAGRRLRWTRGVG